MRHKSNDDLFGPLGKGPVHPRLRRWAQLAEKHRVVEVEVHRKWDGLTYSPARMFVWFRETRGVGGELDEVLWEDELNQGLIELGAPAVDLENEATRYALALRSALEPVSLRHGQDYARLVLVLDLRNREIGEMPPLADVLKRVHFHRPQPGGDYDQASDAIAAILRGKAQELQAKLEYPRSDAERVLTSALAIYLEEIFHLRSREIWFGKRTV